MTKIPESKDRSKLHSVKSGGFLVPLWRAWGSIMIMILMGMLMKNIEGAKDFPVTTNLQLHDIRIQNMSKTKTKTCQPIVMLCPSGRSAQLPEVLPVDDNDDHLARACNLQDHLSSPFKCSMLELLFRSLAMLSTFSSSSPLSCN